jgi:DNA-binding transcriptional regulator YbjK
LCERCETLETRARETRERERERADEWMDERTDERTNASVSMVTRFVGIFDAIARL